jgi:hypothetical protein
MCGGACCRLRTSRGFELGLGCGFAFFAPCCCWFFLQQPAGVSARQPNYFLCFAKESNQRKATRRLRPGVPGSPALLTNRGAAGQLAPEYRDSNKSGCRGVPLLPRFAALLGAAHGGRATAIRLASHRLDGAPQSGAPRRARRSELCCVPRGRRRGAQRPEGCRPKDGRTKLFEHRPQGGRVLRSPSGREHRSEPGTPGAAVGSPFFDYFLWRSKESNSAVGTKSRRAATQKRTKE